MSNKVTDYFKRLIDYRYNIGNMGGACEQIFPNKDTKYRLASFSDGGDTMVIKMYDKTDEPDYFREFCVLTYSPCYGLSLVDSDNSIRYNNIDEGEYFSLILKYDINYKYQDILETYSYVSRKLPNTEITILYTMGEEDANFEFAY